MKTKLLAIALFAVTAAAVIGYPSLNAKHPDPLQQHALEPGQAPIVDVVFVLDTTGSMSGLIETAKEKIWSIAKTMASAQPTPTIRIGLVGYRDRGDDYVTRTVDLSEDLDSVYAALMDFEASGGGDTPESVNRALFEAVHDLSWSQSKQAYQVIFLVGDAPPHMDYADEMTYPDIVAAARQRGIVVNTIQCGNVSATRAPWAKIASLAGGSYFSVDQAGGAVAYTTPFDDEIATLSKALDETRLFYGDAAERARAEAKVSAARKVHATATVSARARRGSFIASDGGRANFLGDKELVDAVTNGEVRLEELDADALPAALQPMAPAEQQAAIAELADQRNDLKSRIQALASERNAYLEEKVEKAGGAEDSLDQKLFDTVSRQAESAGLTYADDAPEY
jgi:Mg-chelatase subunit ChlD